MCEKYVSLALQHLWFTSPLPDASNSRTFDSNAEKCRINFLFPSIGEKGRTLLLELRELRIASRCLEADDHKERTVLSAHTDEQVQAMFAEKRSNFESALPSLSEVQRQIIREYFF